MSNASQLSFSEFDRRQEEILNKQLAAVRAVVHQSGEKGRAFEYQVMQLLRDFLPDEYGLSTGFVAYIGSDKRPHLTGQLDIIIYDSLRGAPLGKFGACDVFPLEAVYGYVEVKASLDPSPKPPPPNVEKNTQTLWYVMNQSAKMREIKKRGFYVPKEKDDEGKPQSAVEAILRRRSWLPMRSFVFAFELKGKRPAAKVFASKVTEAARSVGCEGHLHGIFVPEFGFFRTRPAKSRSDPDFQKCQYVEESSFSAFRWEMLNSLARFLRFSPAWTPALDQYYEIPSWALSGARANASQERGTEDSTEHGTYATGPLGGASAGRFAFGPTSDRTADEPEEDE